MVAPMHYKKNLDRLPGRLQDSILPGQGLVYAYMLCVFSCCMRTVLCKWKQEKNGDGGAGEMLSDFPYCSLAYFLRQDLTELGAH